jgi:hypothetical protein
MGIKRHIAADYPRRDTVSHIKHWEANRDAMSTLCVAYGYPALQPPQTRSSQPPFKEAPSPRPANVPPFKGAQWMYR